ncbi:MAG: hypothetical protein WEA56_12855 [Balneolaceae bacterium]
MISRWLLTAVTIISVVSCSTSPELESLTQIWEPIGLNEAAVHSIDERNGKLYTGTDQGVYISASSDFSSWNGPELNIEGIQYISLVLDNHQKIIAAAHYWPDFFDEENHVLYESKDDGGTWEAITESAEGLVRQGQPATSFITLRLIEAQSEDLDVLFGYSGVVSRSTDGGLNWEVVFEEGHLSFLVPGGNHPDHIWAGGRVTVHWPYLATTRDGGETWINLSEKVSFNSEATALTAAIYPLDPDVVLVGFISSGPAIRKTTNGGETWETVFQDYVFVL